MQHLDLTALRYFGEAAACGSIRLAADRLHVTPSAVSRQIAKLEHRLGTPLFERRASGVILTAAGALLSEEVEKIDRNLARVRDRIADLEGLRRGEVAMYCMEGAVDTWLPEVIGAFHRRYPAISFKTYVASTDASMQALQEDKCDWALTFRTIDRDDIQVVRRQSEPLIGLVAPSHPLAEHAELSFDAMLDYPLVMPGSSFGTRQIVDRCARSAKRGYTCIVDTNSIAMTKSLVRKGVGLTFLPAFSAQHDLSIASLRRIRVLDMPALAADIQLCARRDRTHTAAARQLGELLTEQFPSLFTH